MNNVGKIILEARRKNGLRQEGLAALAKVNLRTIQRSENNENSPRGKTLQFVYDILEINDKELNHNKSELNLNMIFTVFYGS